MTILPPDQLQAIKARCVAATPGPWLIMREGAFPMVYGPDGERICRGVDSLTDVRFIAHAREHIPALLAHIERLQRQYTMTCPYCDFGSGQRGVDRCPHCDDTGRMDVHVFVARQRDAARAVVDGQKAALEHAWYVLDAAAVGVAPKAAAVMAIFHVEKFIGPRESNFDDATKEVASE